MAGTELRSRREAAVREHMDAENRLDFGAVIDAFSHPRYERVENDRVFNGEAEVRESCSAFLDQRDKPLSLRRAGCSFV